MQGLQVGDLVILVIRYFSFNGNAGAVYPYRFKSYMGCNPIYQVTAFGKELHIALRQCGLDREIADDGVFIRTIKCGMYISAGKIYFTIIGYPHRDIAIDICSDRFLG